MTKPCLLNHEAKDNDIKGAIYEYNKRRNNVTAFLAFLCRVRQSKPKQRVSNGSRNFATNDFFDTGIGGFHSNSPRQVAGV